MSPSLPPKRMALHSQHNHLGSYMYGGASMSILTDSQGSQRRRAGVKSCSPSSRACKANARPFPCKTKC